MSEETKVPPDDEEVPLRPGEVRLRPVQQVTVTHLEEAAPAPDEKRIHPRRPLPAVPEKPTSDKPSEDADQSSGPPPHSQHD